MNHHILVQRLRATFGLWTASASLVPRGSVVPGGLLQLSQLVDLLHPLLNHPQRTQTTAVRTVVHKLTTLRPSFAIT